MIEPTDEMREAQDRAIECAGDDGTAEGGDRAQRAGLAAVLALVERDYRLDRICREELMPGVHCARPAHVRGDHEAALPTGNTVKWS